MRYIDSSEDIKVLPWIVVETGTLYIRRGHFKVIMILMLFIVLLILFLQSLMKRLHSVSFCHRAHLHRGMLSQRCSIIMLSGGCYYL